MNDERKVPTDNLFQQTLANPTVKTVLDEVYLQGAGGDFRVGRITAAGVEILTIKGPYNVKDREDRVRQAVMSCHPIAQRHVDATWRSVSQAPKYHEAEAFQKRLRTPASKHYFRQH